MFRQISKIAIIFMLAIAASVSASFVVKAQTITAPASVAVGPTITDTAPDFMLVFSESVIINSIGGGASVSPPPMVSATTHLISDLTNPSATGTSYVVTFNVTGAGGTVVLPLTVNLDATAPTITSFASNLPARIDGAQAFSVVFSEPVTGFDQNDLLCAASCTIAPGSPAVAGSTYIFVVTPSAANANLNISLNASGVQDAVGNALTIPTPSPVATTFYDNTAPTFSVTQQLPSTMGGTTAQTVTVLFSEAIAGFAANQVVQSGTGSVTIGTPTQSTTNLQEFSFSVTPATSGSVELNLSNTITDVAGNALTVGTAAATATTVDASGPTATITFQEAGAPVTTARTTSLDAIITFSEPVTNVQLSQFTITPSSIPASISPNNPTASQTVYTLSLPLSTVTAGQTVNVALSSTAPIQDALGNLLASGASGSIVYDAVTPTVAITGLADYFNDPQTVTFTFSEPVVGFDNVDDVFLENATATGTPTLNAGTNAYTLQVTGTSPGLVTVGLKAGATPIEDANGNALTISAVTRDTGTFDNTGPTPSFVGAPTGVVTSRTVNIEVNFVEPVDPTTFTASDFTVTGAMIDDIQPVAGSNNARFTITVRPTATSVSIALPAGGIEDRAGNTNLAAATPVTFTHNDQNGPVPTFTHPSPVGANFPVTLVFDEAIDPLDPLLPSELSITPAGATITNLTSTGDNRNFAFDVAVTGTDQTYTINLAANAVRDGSGNQNAIATSNFIWDTAPPTITSAVIQGVANVGDSFNQTAIQVVVTTSKPTRLASNLSLASIGRSGLVFNSSSPSCCSPVPALVTEHTLNAAVTSASTAHPVSFTIGAGIFIDAASNASVALSTVTYQFDPVPPVATITTNLPSSNVATGPFTATFTLDNPSTNFGFSDIASPSNATLSNFAMVSPTVYTVTVTPRFTGPVDINVPANGFTDPAGNMNVASPTFTASYAPTSLNVLLEGLAPTITGPQVVTISFSDFVTGFDVSDISVVNANASLSNFTPATGVNANRQWTVTVTPSPTTASGGQISLQIPANSANSAANSAIFNGVSNTLTALYDGDNPTVVSVVPSANPLTVASVGTGTFSLAVTFSEAMDISVLPTVELRQENNSVVPFLSNQVPTWNSAQTVLTVSYTVVSFNGSGAINVAVEGAQDLAARMLARSEHNAAFRFLGMDVEVLGEQNTALAAHSLEATRSAIKQSAWAVGRQINGRFKNRLRNRPDQFYRFGGQSAPDGLALHSSDFQNAADAREAEKLEGLDGTLRASIGRNSRAYITQDDRPSFWFSAGINDQRFEGNTVKSEGQGYFGRVGADVFLSRNLLVGINLGVDSKKTEISQASETTVESLGLAGGAYAGYLIGEIVTLEAAVEYNFGSADITTNIGGGAANTGSFDSSRILGYLKSSVTQEITPQISVLHGLAVNFGRETTEAYTTSNGVAVSSQSVDLGTFTYSADLQQHDLLFVGTDTYLRGQIDYNFATAEAGDSGYIEGLSDEKTRFGAGAGLNASVFDTGSTVSLDADYSGLGSDNQVITLQGSLLVPF